jgi:hypothetical protein
MPDTPASESDVPQPAPERRPRRRRRIWPWVVGGVLLLIILLLILAPIIASTGPGRSFVVNRINSSIDGRVVVNNWSVGWLSGTSVTGLRIYDEQNRLILELGSMRSGISLLDLLRGRMDLGETDIDALNLVQLEIDRQGQTNLARVLGVEPAEPEPDEPLELPQLRGRIRITNFQGTLLVEGAPHPIYIEPSNISLDIPHIDQAIENVVDVAIRAGDGQTGRLRLAGTIDAFENGRLDVAQLAGDQALELESIDLAMFSPLLAMAGVDLRAEGIMSGAWRLAAGTTIETDGNLQVANMNLWGLDEHGQPQLLLSDEQVELLLAGRGDTGEDKQQLAVTQLSVTTTSDVLNLQVAPERELVFLRTGDGRMSGSGLLLFNGDLKRLNDLAQAWQAQPAADPAIELHSGRFDGTIEMVRGDIPRTDVRVGVQLSDLTVGQYLQNESLQLVLAAAAPDDMTIVHASAEVMSDFATVRVPAAHLLVRAADAPEGKMPGMWTMLRHAEVIADAPDLPKLWALIEALSPSATTDPAAPAAPDEPPLPPLEVAAGSAHLHLMVDRAEDATRVRSEAIRATGLELRRGEQVWRPQRDIELQVAAAIDAADDPSGERPLLEQVRRLSVQTLAGESGVGTIRLDEPIVLEDLASQPRASGAVHVAGQFEPVIELLEVLQGEPMTNGYRYTGGYELAQRISTEGDAITIMGQFTGIDVRVHEGQNVVFHEQRLEVANDLAADTANQLLDIRSLSINMISSQALRAGVGGRVSDWQTTRRLENVVVDLEYDLARLIELLRPMLPEDMRDAQATGQAQRRMVISGTYPTDVPAHEALRGLVVEGGLLVGSFVHSGLTVENLDLVARLEDGVLRLSHVRDEQGQPVYATANNGVFNLDGGEIYLAEETPRLTFPDDHLLIHGATLNPVLADSLLGRFVNNPLFVNPRDARGLLDVRLVQCRRLPLGELVQQSGPENDGRAEVLFAISELHIGNHFVEQMGQALGRRVGTLRGDVRDARVVIESGVVNQNLDLRLADFNLGFAGSVRMADQALMPLMLEVPSAYVGRFDRNLLRYLPERIELPIYGTTTSPRFEWGDVLTRLATDAGTRALTERLVPRRDPPPQQPADPDAPVPPAEDPPVAEPAPQDPLRGILEGILDRDRRRERDRQ